MNKVLFFRRLVEFCFPFTHVVFSVTHRLIILCHPSPLRQKKMRQSISFPAHEVVMIIRLFHIISVCLADMMTTIIIFFYRGDCSRREKQTRKWQGAND